MGTKYRVHTEWQWPFSGVYSIMMVKSAQPAESGVARSPPFTLSTITSKVVVYASAERAQYTPLFLIYPYMYSVGPPPPTTKKVKDDVQSNNEMHQTACFFTLCSYESGTSLMHKEGDTRITW